MNVVGLVVEYNPLHNGHVYHYEQAKKVTQADAVVLIMSGNFLQRGEPALVHKWARTEMALEMGADLVIELPYVYATQQAEYFAFGAVFLLDKLPFVTHLCFGSESGELSSLLPIARLMVQEPESFKQSMKEKLRQGHSYPQAYSHALTTILDEHQIDTTLFSQPNNILGLHYLMALFKLNSSIIPTTIKREKAGYHDREFIDQQIASATSIRQALFSNAEPDWEKIQAYVPHFTLEILKREASRGLGPISWESYYPYLIQSFLSQSPEHLQKIYEVGEGIEHRLIEKAKGAASVEELIQQVKSKRYTWNRLQRMLLHTFTQFHKQDAEKLGLDKGPAYFRLLGYSTKGQELLNRFKKEIELPIISSIRRQHPEMLEWDLKTSLLYSLGFRNQAIEFRKRELWQPPLTIK